MNKLKMPNAKRSIGHLLVSVAFVFMGASAMAQAGNRFGLKGGVSWTNLRGESEEVSDEDMRLGFHGGIFGRVAPSEQLGVQFELLYSQKGTRFIYDGLIDQETTFKLDYIELPVFAAIGVGDMLELHAGVYAGFLVSSSATTEGDLGSDAEDLDRDNFQGMDFGLLGGVGVNLGRAQLGLRYLHGMADIAASDEAKFLLGDARNSAFQLYLAFGLGGS